MRNSRERRAVVTHQPLRCDAVLTGDANAFDAAGLLGRTRVADPHDRRRSRKGSQIDAVAEVVINRQEQIEALAASTPQVAKSGRPPKYDPRSVRGRLVLAGLRKQLTSKVDDVHAERLVVGKNPGELPRRPTKSAKAPERGIHELVGDDADAQAPMHDGTWPRQSQ